LNLREERKREEKKKQAMKERTEVGKTVKIPEAKKQSND
jgi:hypothetical protein